MKNRNQIIPSLLFVLLWFIPCGYAAPAITLSTNAVSVVEGTTNSTVTIVLSEAVANTVKVYGNWISGDDGLQIRPTLLPFVFTTNNWNTQQVVQVMASEDFDGTNGTALIQFSATDLDTVDFNVTELDNDDLVIPLRELGIWSGSNGAIPVKLAAAPAGDTTVTVENVAGNANISVTAGSPLIFTTGNWDIYQTSTVHVASDADTLCTPATLSASAPGLTSCDVEVWEQETATYFITTNVLQATPGRIGMDMSGGVQRPYYPFQMGNARNACSLFEPVVDWEHGQADDGGTNWLWSPFIQAVNDGIGHWRFYGDGYFDGQSISFFREESNTLSWVRTETITSFEGSTGSSERIYFTTTNGVAPIQSNDWYVIQSRWVNTPSNSGSFKPKEWLQKIGTGTVYEHDDTTAAPEWDSTTSLKITVTDGTGGGVYEWIGKNVNPQDYRTLQTNATYTFSVWLKHAGLSDSNVSFTLNGTTVSTHFTVGTGWQKFTHTFAGESNPNTNAYSDIRLKTAGAGTLWVDNMILYDAAMEPMQTVTHYLSELQALKPKVLRNLELLHTPIKERLCKSQAAPSRLARSYDADFEHTLPAILELAKEAGADPWLVLNAMMTPDEHQLVMEYLVGATNTTYGALRATHGHPAPWTDEFETIYLECHNEAWNTAFEVNFPAELYAKVAEYFATQLKSDPLFNTNDFRIIANGRGTGGEAWSQVVGENVPSADVIDVAFYIGGWDGFTIPGSDDTDLFKNQLYYSPRIVEPTLEQTVPMAVSNGLGLAMYEGGPGYPVPSASSTYDPESEFYGKSLGLAVASLDEYLYMARCGFESINHYIFGAGRNWVTHSDYISMRRHAVTHAIWLYQNLCNGPMITPEAQGVRTIDIPESKGYGKRWDSSIKELTLPGRDDVANVVNYSFVDSNDVYTVMLLSREIEMETPVRLQLPFALASTGTLYRLEADSPAAQNTYSNEVEIVETALTGLSGSAYDLTLKPYSVVVAKFYPDGTPSVPTAPSGLAATNVQASQVDLVWTDNSSDEAWFVLERRLSSSIDYTEIAQVDGSSYIDFSVIDGSEYVYRVRAYNLAGYSGESTCPVALPYGGDRAVEPLADAYTFSSDPDVNYGTSTGLEDGATRRMYLKFDMLSIGGTVTSATVRLYHRDYGDTVTDITLYALTNGWAEDTITWNNQPAFGEQLVVTTGVGSNAWLEFDVTDYIQTLADGSDTNTVVSFAVDSSMFSRYSSKENSDGNTPELHIIYGGEPVVAVIELSTNNVSVPEGSTNTFNVRLDRFVSTPQTVTVARVIGGDDDLTVTGGTPLVFNSTTWSNWQTVTLSAALDLDSLNGSATFRCSASGMLAVDVEATEQDSNVPSPFFSEPMDSDPGWATSGQWAFGVPTGLGGEYGSPDPTAGYTSTNVYGYNLSGDYENSITVTNWLTTSVIDCSNYTNVTLAFQRWLGVESPSYDHAHLEVSTDGANWSSLWQNTARMDAGSWEAMEYNLSTTADEQSTVYLRWGIGVTDSSWQFCGWNIDDITLTGDYIGTDMDSDGLPDSWEALYYGGFTNANPAAMASNGVNTVEEAYIADISPIDPNAFFLISTLSPLVSESILEWNAASGRIYNVYWTSNLLTGFGAPWKTNLTGGIFTDATHSAEDEGFYKIEVELE